MIKQECSNDSEVEILKDKEATITLFEKVKSMNIEEMADFLAPLFNECYSCEFEHKNDCDACESCTDEKQRNNIIKILNEEAN